MTARTRALVYLLPVLAGAIIATWWVRAAGGGNELVTGLRRANLLSAATMLALTAGWVGARFVRWQFLLRRVGIRLPIRHSLACYLAGLPGTATPAYVGEVVRGVLIKRRFNAPLRTTTAVLVIERLYDVLALAIIAVATASTAQGAWLGLGFVGLVMVITLACWPLARHAFISREDLARLAAPASLFYSLLLSLAAWATASALVPVGMRAIGGALPWFTGVYVFASSTLAGALTLLPAGLGATGSAQIVQLTSLGIPQADAIFAVTLVRLTSSGAALSVGAWFLWRELRAKPAVVSESAAHFDDIATQYSAQWSPHVWDHLLTRKIDMMVQQLPPAGKAPLGLDLGCGLGRQLTEMSRRGYRMVGVEPSAGLLRTGRANGQRVLAGDARKLPFADASFDFVYAVGVLHHLKDAREQALAYGEVLRVLKPGGLLLVHETNPRNPLFRFYMGYVFPILKEIDEGTEWWVHPDQPAAPAGLRLKSVLYFTFLPDFTPISLMKMATAFEQLLERSVCAPYAAHYLAVLRRES